MRTLLIIAAILAGLYFLGRQPSTAEAPEAPSGRLEVVSTACEARTNHTNVDVTVRNAGPGEVHSAKAFIEVAGETVDGYVTPRTIPAGSLASVSTTARQPGVPRSADVPCRVVALQDRNGRSLL